MIAPLSSSIPLPAAPALTPVTSAPSNEFHNLLTQSINAVEQKRTEADGAVNRFLNGETEELHSAAIAGQRAELSLELFLQVRNKVVQAYQEVMRMQM